MSYKQALKKEFEKILSETALNIIFTETDLLFSENDTNKNDIDSLYSEQFINSVQKFVFGKYKSPESKNFLTNYLNNILTMNINDIKKLKLICDFYKKIMIFPEIEHIINLLYSNTLLYSCIERIYEQNKNLILKDSIEKIIDDDIFIQFIEVYLDINDIEKEEETFYEVELDKLPSFDATKMLLLETRKYPLLKHDEITNLFKKNENGDKNAKNKLILHNLRLVLNIAKRYSNPNNPLSDLFQEGTIGLEKAIERFEYKKGYRFSTYATWWIRQVITRYITEKGYAIRVPVHLRDAQIKFKRTYNDIRIMLGHNPTMEEIAKNSEYNLKTIKKLMNLPDDLKSLNETHKDSEDSEFGDFISDEILTLEEEAEKNILSKEIQNWLDTYLTPKEQTILKSRFGLDSAPKTLEEIAKEFGVTRERIRQIEVKSLRKLRRSKTAAHFIDYMENPIEAHKYLQEIKKTGPATKPLKKKNNDFSTNNATSSYQRYYYERSKQQKENLAHKEENMSAQSEYVNNLGTRKRRSRNNLYQYFSENSVEQIDAIIVGLDPKEKLLLQQIYGNDLKNPTKFEVTDEIKISFYGLMEKIKRRLNPKLRQTSGRKVIETKRTIKIYEYFAKYPEELIDKAIEMLTPSQKDVLKLRYGNDLKNPQINPYPDRNAQQRVYNTFKRINNILIEMTTVKSNNKNENSGTRKSRSNLYQYFSENSEEQIDRIIEGLDPKEKLLLQQIYGNDLKNPTKFEVTDEIKISFYGLMEKIKRRLANKPRKKVIENKKTIRIYEHFSEYPVTLIDKAIEMLSDKQKETLKLRYGDDLKNPQIIPYSQKSMSQDIHYIIGRIDKLLKKLTTEKNTENIEFEEKSNNNISELYDNMNFIDIIHRLPIKESAIMFLRKNYSNQEIAEALNLSIEEVIQISKNAICSIKAIYCNIFDREIKHLEKTKKI